MVISLMSKANHARVHCRFEDGVCELVLDNPGRKNALSLSLLADLNSKLNKAGDEKARAVVLTGAGNTFSSGADLADLTGTADDLAIDKAIEQVVDHIRTPAWAAQWISRWPATRWLHPRKRFFRFRPRAFGSYITHAPCGAGTIGWMRWRCARCCCSGSASRRTLRSESVWLPI